MTTIEYAKKLNEMENELLKIKKGIAAPKIKISLYGVLKGAKISAKDIKATRKSLFKKASL